ncbi:Hypothetical predicted protein [Lecanosticta acicola]|uniref:Glycosyl transferase CAP10 domain-containing protein n=1 Tax=Lecanosticta acicola TaxID=111012 RepID=A0AAI8YTK2_9PEZI|nr:Hypothetical predicted protein [Lecanosticta acicola]
MESLLSWKRLCYLLILLILIQFIAQYRGLDGSSTSPNPFTSQQQIPLNPEGEPADGLTQTQCDKLFPELYQEVDRAVAYWKGRGHTISPQDVDVSWRHGDDENRGGAIRILIHNNELRIVESKDPTIGHIGHRGREVGFLNILQRAIDSATAGGEKLPTIEAAIITQDIATNLPPDSSHAIWTWTRNVENEAHNRHWLIPNFDFWYSSPMGSYLDARRRAVQYSASFSEKIQKAVWRGTGWVNFKLRGALADLAKGKDWADIKILDFGGPEMEDGLAIEELCKYAMTVHTEGVSYSGRLKYLFNCDSLPIIHELEWMVYWYAALKKEGPQQNYIPVKRDWSDLEDKVKYYLAHPDESQRIIDNHLATFRDKYLTRAATSCYLRKLIQGYSTVAFTPEIYRPLGQGDGINRLRGISFESFTDIPRDFNESTLRLLDV